MIAEAKLCTSLLQQRRDWRCIQAAHSHAHWCLFFLLMYFQWDNGAIQAARADLLCQLADPGRQMIGPEQLQDVAEAVEQSGGWHIAVESPRRCRTLPCRCSGVPLKQHCAAVMRKEPDLPLLLLPSLAVGAGVPWQIFCSQTVISQIRAPKLLETVHLQPRLLASICK